ncbi:hypothetical protein COOONC_02575 [Cooperia oncophora]
MRKNLQHRTVPPNHTRVVQNIRLQRLLLHLPTVNHRMKLLKRSR